MGPHGRRTARSAASALQRVRRRDGRAGQRPLRSRRRSVRCVLRPPAGSRSRYAEGGRHVSRAAAARGGACRPPVRRRRIRPVAPHAPARQDGRGRPLVRAQRLPQRRRHHGAVGWPRRVHDAERLRDDARLRERVDGRRRPLCCEPVPVAAGELADGTRVPRVPAHGIAGRRTADGRRRGAAAADQGLPASRREDLRRAGLGSRFQLRGFPDAVPPVRHQRALRPPLPGLSHPNRGAPVPGVHEQTPSCGSLPRDGVRVFGQRVCIRPC
ncbi:putative 4-hydroxy-tetrahydrodipicolinate reductase [Burkholderia sp. IT-111MI5]